MDALTPESKLDAIPTTMRAAAIDAFGGPEALKPHILPVPEIDSGEVLIRVDTAGVGGWDADIRGGWWPGNGKPRFPLVLGTDGAGTVAAVGSRIRRFKPGDRVYSYVWNNPKGGFYAEYVAAPADRVARIPEELDLLHAGAVPTTGLTALQGVDDALRLRAGETVIIHGASGGVGTLALQFAKRVRALAIASASGREGVALAKRLGADFAIDGKRSDIAATALRVAPQGIDAVLGLAGGDALERCLDALRKGGRLAFPNGIEPAPKKRRGITVIAYDAAAGVREFDKLNRAVSGARLQVPIAAEFRLEEAAKAHRHLAKGHVLGKIVLRVG